jgi:hypothetical protein
MSSGSASKTVISTWENDGRSIPFGGAFGSAGCAVTSSLEDPRAFGACPMLVPADVEFGLLRNCRRA